MSAKIGKVGKKGGEMREKEKQKKRHEGINPYVSFNFGSGY